MSVRVQEPGSTATYNSDWSAYLASGETISAYLWTITPDEGSMLTNDTTSICTVANVVRGRHYALIEKITTSAGRVAERLWQVVCERK